MSSEELENQMAVMTMLSEIVGGAVNNIAQLDCEKDLDKRKESLKRSMEFYACLAEELNNIVKEKNPLFAIKNFKEQMNSITGKQRNNNTRKMINMKGGVGKEIVPYTNKQGRTGKLTLYKHSNIQKYHGMEASVIIRAARDAAKKGNIAKAIELAGVVDDLVKADEDLERAVPYVSELKWSLMGTGIGAILGVAVFYLAIIGATSMPAGIAAGTAQYAANAAATATRSAASFVTFGKVSANVQQPDPTETARNTAQGIQRLIESVISDRVAISYMTICAIGCMVASYITARRFNVHLFTVRRAMDPMLNKRKQTIRNRARNILVEENAEFDKQREINLGLLNLKPGASKNNIKKAYRSKVLEYHPDKHSNKNNSVKEEMSKKFQELQEAHDRLKVNDAPKKTFW